MSTTPSPKESSILIIFNYVGGALIFLGIAYFIVDNWNILNNFTRVFSTLGAAMAAYIVGLLFHLSHKYEAASAAFFMIAGLVMPIGLQVTFNIYGKSVTPEVVNMMITGLCLLVFLASLKWMPRTLFLLFSIIFASLFYFSLIDFIVSRSLYFDFDIFNYEIMALGFSYLFLGYYLDRRHRHILVGPLYFFGVLCVLSASLYFGSYIVSGETSVLWKAITAILIILTFMFSVPLRSKSFLYLGAVFLVLYVCDISDNFIRIFGELGWPLILILMGLLLMSVGYMVFFIHRKINRIKLD
ncbi:hypothetical protein AQUSIP_02200 [Aquicella siphonis]|uniref:DUF2157 domain-containing protein n=1 Tax=Aquicella siphonis TaxID=254247 RepID=A0A5E4PF42_9COXI|nr:DUF2157 domain-containing protein [Aquicella siphonis]VVC74946.1 hypothetical protein AQUSIP_02200 [Aquicella siphonis]